MWGQLNIPFNNDWYTHHISINDLADFLTKPLFMFSLAIHNPSQSTLLRPPFAQTLGSGTGIFNLLSIAYSNWPRLRGRLTLS